MYHSKLAMSQCGPALYKSQYLPVSGARRLDLAASRVKFSIIVGLVGRQAQLLSSAQPCSMALPRQPPARGSNRLAQLLVCLDYYMSVLIRPSRDSKVMFGYKVFSKILDKH